MNGINDNDNDNDNDNTNGQNIVKENGGGGDHNDDSQNNDTAKEQQEPDPKIISDNKTVIDIDNGNNETNGDDAVVTNDNGNGINGEGDVHGTTTEDHNSVTFVDDDNISNISDSLPHQTSLSHHPDNNDAVERPPPTTPSSAHKRNVIQNGGTSDQYSIGGVSSNVSTTAHTSTSSPISSSSSPRRLSPLGIVVKKCSKELQAKPPLSEKRSILILQSLLGVLETKESTVISPSYSSNSSHSMHGGGSSNRNLLLTTAEEQEQASVASHRKNSKLVAIENGALEAIVHTMKLYADSAKLQSKAVLLIKAIGEDYPQQIGQCYAVSYVSAVLTHSKHMKSDSLVYDTLSSLVTICGCDDYEEMFEQPPSADTLRNLSQLIHGDGIRVLRQIMKLHLKRDNIQQCLLQLLCHIANYDTYTTPSEGGVVVVTAASSTATATATNVPASPTRTAASGNASVRSNPSVGNVSRRSTGTGTVAGSSIGLFSQTTSAIEDPDLIELLTQCMSKHKRHCYIQQFAITLLYLLATKGSSRTKSSLVWANAHLSILKAMSIHTLVSDIQYEGSEALYRMALERPEARSSIAEEGSATLLEAMKTHPNHSPINQSCCSLLALLCGHPTTSKYIAKAINKQPHYRSVLSWAQAGHRSDTNCDELVSTILKSYDDHGD